MKPEVKGRRKVGSGGQMDWEFGLSRCKLVYPGIEPTSLTSPALVANFFITSTTWEAPYRERIDKQGPAV